MVYMNDKSPLVSLPEKPLLRPKAWEGLAPTPGPLYQFPGSVRLFPSWEATHAALFLSTHGILATLVSQNVICPQHMATISKYTVEGSKGDGVVLRATGVTDLFPPFLADPREGGWLQ
jgi:hypothetical protein